MTNVVGLKVAELRKLITAKKLSAREIAESFLKHINDHDKTTNAFLTLTESLAISQANAIDRLVHAGEPLPPLAGIPVAVKDNICIQGFPTTCGSKILENFIPPYNATAAERLFRAGAVCVGKGNMDEFAMGSSTENSAYKTTKNPWDFSRVPGGSSGGPAVSVASGYSPIALGSDTGGSIRQPAALCGIVGMKPTYGLVSRFGLVAYASSLDQIGPFALCVEDAALLLSVIAGHDPQDTTSLDDPFGRHNPQGFAPVDLNFVESLSRRSPESICKGKTIGVLTELLSDGIEPEIRDSIKKSITILESLGARIEEISIPNLKHSLAVYYIIAMAEASANLARYDGVRYGIRSSQPTDLSDMYTTTRQKGFGDEVKRRIMLGTYALSSGYYDAYYKKAQQVRRLLKENFDAAFQKCDIVLSTTSPTTAFKIGEQVDDPLTMYLNDIATIPANLAGLPGISIPCGLDSRHLPIGLQLLGPQLSDARLIEVAYAYEQSQLMSEKSPVMTSTSGA